MQDNQLENSQLKNIIEAALMAVAKPMSIEQIKKLFAENEQPEVEQIKSAISELQSECDGRGVELKQVASGYRYQARQQYSEWLSRLWEEKPARYSRAFLETLALIAYRQPVTRAEIEEVRGVSVSSGIIKSMLEREWIRVVGHRDVPGRPALFATTKAFLDYFNLRSLNELPALSEIKDLDELNPELKLESSAAAEQAAEEQATEQTEEQAAEEQATEQTEERAQETPAPMVSEQLELQPEQPNRQTPSANEDSSPTDSPTDDAENKKHKLANSMDVN